MEGEPVEERQEDRRDLRLQKEGGGQCEEVCMPLWALVHLVL